MADFFDAAHRLYEHNELGTFKSDYDTVRRLRNLLWNRQIKAQFDSNHMERVFNAIEMGELLGGIGEMREEELAKCKDSFIRLVLAVLERTQRFTNTSTGTGQHRRMGPKGYSELMHFVQRFRQDHNFAFVTFNYDLGLEIALASRELEYQYPLHETTENWDPIPIFKLHGSLNWFAAETDASRIVPDDSLVRAAVEPAERSELTNFLISDLIRERAGGRPMPVPFIVPPSEEKLGGRYSLRQLWKNASATLGKADCIFVIGYSMPSTDEFFTQFYALSVSNDHELRRFEVYDRSGHCFDRFKDLVGLPMSSRFSTYPMEFEDVAAHIEKQYKQRGQVF